MTDDGPVLGSADQDVLAEEARSPGLGADVVEVVDAIPLVESRAVSCFHHEGGSFHA